jgi:hypothetical protein
VRGIIRLFLDSLSFFFFRSFVGLPYFCYTDQFIVIVLIFFSTGILRARA